MIFTKFEDIIAIGKKYEVIYADPAWEFDNEASQGAAADQYPTMSIEDLKKLPVAEIAAENCALFCWCVHPRIEDCLAVMRAWGFPVKTIGFDWAKQNPSGIGWFFGIGNYTKSNTEPCYLGVKGNVAQMVVDNSVSSLVVAPRGKHSAKPHKVRKNIVQLLGNRSRIELFGRVHIPGWDVWGNQIAEIPMLEEYTLDS